MLLWFAGLRFGRVNKLVATVGGIGALGVVAMARRLAESVQARTQEVESLLPDTLKENIHKF